MDSGSVSFGGMAKAQPQRIRKARQEFTAWPGQLAYS
jgi:hypothetical protein